MFALARSVRLLASRGSVRGYASGRRANILVIDSYTKEGAKELVEGGSSEAGDLYVKMLQKAHPAVQSTIFRPAQGDKLSLKDLDDYDGVAWTGCSLCVYSDDPAVKHQLELARLVWQAQVPSFGSCWALQIAAVAAGGRAQQNYWGREHGIGRKVLLTPAGRAHPMFEGKPDVFDTFMSHEDEVTHLTGAGVILAGNRHSAVQALTVTVNHTDFWAVQYHPEYDLHEAAMLVKCRKEKLTKKGLFRTVEDALAWAQDLEDLHNDPSRKDLRWKLGIDDDLTNEEIRHREATNWVNKLVLPRAIMRHNNMHAAAHVQ